MARSDEGAGFQLPKPDGSDKRTLQPIPEITDGGEWVIRDSGAPTEGNAGLAPEGGGIMTIPTALDIPAAALVRAHEMGHARWTPRGMDPKQSDDFAMQLAEDARIWRRLRSSGVDTSAAAMPPSMARDRIGQGPPEEYLLGLVVATAGTGDRENLRQALRQIRPDVAEDLIAKGEAIHSRYFSEEWPTFGDTLAAAECIRENRAPSEEEESSDQGEGGDQGDQGSEGSDQGDQGEGGNQGGRQGSEGSEGSEGSDQGGEGSDQGEGEGSDQGEGDDAGTFGGGTPSGVRRPTGQARRAITNRVRKAAKDLEKQREEAKQEEAPAANLTPEEKAAGEKTTRDILGVIEGYGWTLDKTPAGTMTIERVPLRKRLPAKMRGRTYRAGTFGGRLGNVARVNTDGILFRSRRMSTGGGTVLIDCSGSMSLADSEVMDILEIAPAVTIATYNGMGRKGWLRIIARNGRRADSADFQPQGCGNIVDVPALEWLAKQPSRPRIWVSDGIVTGCHDSLSEIVRDQCVAIVQRAGIARVRSLSELKRLAKVRR